MSFFSVLTAETGFKALSWDVNNRIYTSPSRAGFPWTKDGLVVASCVRYQLNGQDAHQDENPPGIPGINCTCGFYVPFYPVEAKGYFSSELSVLLIMEGSGKICICEDGFRSKEATVRAVVRFFDRVKERIMLSSQIGSGIISRYILACYQASEYFHVPVLDLEAAIIAVDIWNYLGNMSWYMIHSETTKHCEGRDILEVAESIGLYPREENWIQQEEETQ